MDCLCSNDVHDLILRSPLPPPTGCTSQQLAKETGQEKRTTEGHPHTA